MPVEVSPLLLASIITGMEAKGNDSKQFETSGKLGCMEGESLQVPFERDECLGMVQRAGCHNNDILQMETADNERGTNAWISRRPA